MRLFDHILEELGWPNIYLVSPEQFKAMEGWDVHTVYGGAGEHNPTVTIVRSFDGKVLDYKTRKNVLYHEILHHLFPHRPHWWIEVVAQKLANGGGRGAYSKISGHTVNDVPSRQKLVKLIKRASKRYNEKHKEVGL